MFCIRILDIHYSVSFSFNAPWDSAASRLAGRAHAERRSREAISLPKRESSIWWEILNLGRTYFEQNPQLSRPAAVPETGTPHKKVFFA
ncbi:MAG: hypothetical protein HY006_00275, partial [Candidatus Sungbacteria bacterium]|nr:hypothetical protein [Candidatus Sungbacteria bacterium]